MHELLVEEFPAVHRLQVAEDLKIFEFVRQVRLRGELVVFLELDHRGRIGRP